jgi:uncharacterized protein (TIGR04255 family)
MLSVDLGIPEQPRLRNAPLRLALCQIRFPTLFGLQGSEVRPFAQALSEEYPKTSEDNLVAQQIEISPLGVRQHGGQQQPAYRFESEAGDWIATLTQDWLSLETTAYPRFPEFAERWHRLFLEAQNAFKLSHENRLGLRYVNELSVGQEASPAKLQEILSSAVLGPVSLDLDAQGLIRSWQEIRFKHPDGGCTMQHGYVQNVKQDWVYVLDFDGYREGHREIDAEEQLRALAQINHHIFGLFQRSVTEELFATFDPQEQP